MKHDLYRLKLEDNNDYEEVIHVPLEIPDGLLPRQRTQPTNTIVISAIKHLLAKEKSDQTMVEVVEHQEGQEEKAKKVVSHLNLHLFENLKLYQLLFSLEKGRQIPMTEIINGILKREMKETLGNKYIKVSNRYFDSQAKVK